jgi:ribosomal protein S18 acetylase RimI-like enzyme
MSDGESAAIRTVRLTPANAGLLDRIEEDVFDEPIDAERLTAYIREPGHLMILAVIDDRVVGMCTAMVHRHADKVTELYVDEVGVTERLHRRGIGGRMVRGMLDWGRELGCAEAWVGTEVDNIAARALYRSFGPTEEDPSIIYVYKLE